MPPHVTRRVECGAASALAGDVLLARMDAVVGSEVGELGKGFAAGWASVFFWGALFGLLGRDGVEATERLVGWGFGGLVCVCGLWQYDAWTWCHFR